MRSPDRPFRTLRARTLAILPAFNAAAGSSDMHSLVIHGGTGAIPADLPDFKRKPYEAALTAVLDAGFEVLARGGASLDAVTLAVRLLEDEPLFNAGRGAALSREGQAELDASIMDGRERRAGSVAGVRHVKNPIDLARWVMEHTPHVMLIGQGADELAITAGLPLVSNEYFRTDARRRQLAAEQQGRQVSDLVPAAHGTVGAVARDAQGNLAAATSTGGMTNKPPGRVGDTPIIGAGTYAKNGVCAVSCTGHGEYFMRCAAAHHIVAAVEHRALSLQQAAKELLEQDIARLGGFGGLIGVDAAGNMVMEFTTSGMFRAARDANGQRLVALSR
jgi:beta-aspartyl-peptidase (threonine type)